MADDDLDDDLDDDEEGLEGEEYEGEEGEESGDTGRKRLLIVIAAVVLLVLGGATAAYFLGFLDPLIKVMSGTEAEDGALEDEGGPVITGDVVFFDVPEILVTLNTAGRKQAILRIVVSLELEDANDIPEVEAKMARVVDSFQVYLRELRVEDLKGSSGMYRLREELLKRVNASVAPATVSDVLFKEMMVQ